MVTYQDYAKDLRTLAAMLDHLAYRLPLPKYPEQGLDIQIHTASHLDIDQAAKILDVPTLRVHGHTTSVLDVGTVHLKFVHVNATATAAYKARMARANAVAS